MTKFIYSILLHSIADRTSNLLQDSAKAFEIFCPQHFHLKWHTWVIDISVASGLKIPYLTSVSPFGLAKCQDGGPSRIIPSSQTATFLAFFFKRGILFRKISNYLFTIQPIFKTLKCCHHFFFLN